VEQSRLIHIRGLKKNELNLFFKACEDEAWFNDISHVKCLYNSYPDDFFIAYQNNDLIGFVLAIKESASFATISNLLILKKYRSLGYGKQLLEHALLHLNACQIMIDSVLGKEKLYEKYDFKAYYETSLYKFESGSVTLPKSFIEVKDVTEFSLLKYNKKINSLKKDSYFKCMFKDETSIYKAVYKNEDISSLAIRLNYKDGYKFVISSDDINEAITLIFKLLDGVKKSTPIYIEVTPIQQLLFAIVELLKMQKVSSTTKMYNKILN